MLFFYYLATANHFNCNDQKSVSFTLNELNQLEKKPIHLAKLSAIKYDSAGLFSSAKYNTMVFAFSSVDLHDAQSKPINFAKQIDVCSDCMYSKDKSFKETIGFSEEAVSLERQSPVIIAFGGSYNVGAISDSTTWEIIHNGCLLTFGKGDSLNYFVYEKPGEYQLLINENISESNGQCNHNHLPQSLTVIVSPVRMVFDLNQVQLSQHPKAGQDTKGIILTVPVTVTTYGKPDLTLIDTVVTTTGIQTDIMATLISSPKLKAGTQLLTYQLSGIAHQPAYIMFNFIDINRAIYPYGYSKMIQ